MDFASLSVYSTFWISIDMVKCQFGIFADNELYIKHQPGLSVYLISILGQTE